MVRKLTILVTNLTEPKTLERFWAGMQYEDNATRIVFDLGSINIQNALYRIDFNSNGAGYHPSKNLTVSNGCIERDIPKAITQYGGEVHATAVITELDSSGNETGTVYSYPVVLYFTEVEKSQFGNETVEGNISEMEAAVKAMTERSEEASASAVASAESALLSKELTEEARFALERDSEFVFLGGDANGSVSTELVIDGEMSDVSQNPIMNKTVKAYVDRATDFIVEQGTTQVKANEGSDDEYTATWTYRKWNSGIAELWCAVGMTTAFTNKVAEGHYHGSAFPRPPYPFNLIGTIHPQFSLYYAECHNLQVCMSGNKGDLVSKPPEFIPYQPWAVTEEKSVTGRYYVMGKWK